MILGRILGRMPLQADIGVGERTKRRLHQKHEVNATGVLLSPLTVHSTSVLLYPDPWVVSIPIPWHPPAPRRQSVARTTKIFKTSTSPSIDEDDCKQIDLRRDRTCNLLIRSQAPCHWASRPVVIISRCRRKHIIVLQRQLRLDENRIGRERPHWRSSLRKRKYMTVDLVPTEKR